MDTPNFSASKNARGDHRLFTSDLGQTTQFVMLLYPSQYYIVSIYTWVERGKLELNTLHKDTTRKPTQDSNSQPFL